MSSPALALRASLEAAGLLRHHGGHTAADQELAWSTAQAVHQGDRLLRTARSMLAAHALVHGDHCSLWAVDGPEVVAVACESVAPGAGGGLRCLGLGQRLAIGLEAARLLQRSNQGDHGLGLQAPDRRAWTTMFQLALGTDVDEGGGALTHLIASVIPWAPCALVLVTSEGTLDRVTLADHALCPGHELRHSALSMGLAWSLEAVVC